MPVEAAWSIATQPGPLRAFFARIKERRGQQIAAVATARKRAALIWHLLTKEKDYAWTRPALMQWKLHELELRAGRASRRGGNKPGPARDYSLKTVHAKEREWLGLAPVAVAHARTWRSRGMRFLRGACNCIYLAQSLREYAVEPAIWLTRGLLGNESR
jgi:hypothetical protein